MGIQSLLNVIDDLDRTDRRRVLKHIEKQDNSDDVLEVVEALKPDEEVCPDCDSPNKRKDGMRAGRQRYRCKDCGRYYTELSNTPIEGLRASLETFAQFYELLKDQAPIREIAEKLDLSTQTVFRWRHKIMEFFTKLHEQQELSGIVEADETYLPHSKKGDKDLGREPRERGGTSDHDGLSRDQDCILTLKDRSGNIYIKLVGQARPSYDDIKEPILNNMEIDSVLCTDGMQAYGKLSREHGIERKNTQKVDERSYHIQGINSLHSQIKEWLWSFHGIASKYIDNYLGFFAYQKALASA